MFRGAVACSSRFCPRASINRDVIRAYSSSNVAPTTISSLIYPENQPSLSNESDRNPVTVQGFVRSIRKQKNVAFVSLGDGTTLKPLQVVLSPHQVEGLSTGVAVAFVGEWKSSVEGSKQSHELRASSVNILGHHDEKTYPLQKKYHSPDFLRTIPHLRARLPINTLILRLRSQVVSSTTSYFENEGFLQTHPPILTSSDCEGAGEAFSVGTGNQQDGSKVEHFFKSPKYLTVSSQLHLEALAQSAGKVWTLSPTFRAEQSDTPRHLSEFYMLEAEVAFAKDLNHIMYIVEGLLKSIVDRLYDSQVGEELLSVTDGKLNAPTSENSITRDVLQRRWSQFKDGNWPRISYSDAVELLKRAVTDRKARFKFAPIFGNNLQAEHEKYIAETVGNVGPVFITDYPRDLKAFYMSLSPSQSSQVSSSELTVSCFDLVVPELCELVGGSMREHQLDLLLKSMEDHGLLKENMEEETIPGKPGTISLARVPENLKWYADLRRWGSVPHGGFGLGFDRLLCYLSGVSSIRDLVAFPRWHGRCDC